MICGSQFLPHHKATFLCIIRYTRDDYKLFSNSKRTLVTSRLDTRLLAKGCADLIITLSPSGARLMLSISFVSVLMASKGLNKNPHSLAQSFVVRKCLINTAYVDLVSRHPLMSPNSMAARATHTLLPHKTKLIYILPELPVTYCPLEDSYLGKKTSFYCPR